MESVTREIHEVCGHRGAFLENLMLRYSVILLIGPFYNAAF